MLRTAAFLIFCFCTITAAAQGFFPQRTQFIYASQDTIQLDTLSIVPGSFHARTEAVLLEDSIDYTIDYAAAKLYIKPSHLNQRIEVGYEVFPILLTAERYHKNQGTMTSTPENRVNPFLYNPTKQKYEDP